MIKHNIILVECNPLYQILFEIKNNFLFEMKNFILKDLNNTDLTNSIILSKFIHKDYLLKNKNIEQKKIIFLLKKDENFNKINNTQYIFYPFNIYDLVVQHSCFEVKWDEIKTLKSDQFSSNYLFTN